MSRLIVLCCILVLSYPLCGYSGFEKNWTVVKEKAGVVYFLKTKQNIIERYNLKANSFLNEIKLEDEVFTMDLDESSIYLGSYRKVTSMSHDGDEQFHLHNLPGRVSDIIAIDHFLYVNYERGEHNAMTINKITGEEISRGGDWTFYDPAPGSISYSSSLNSIFFRTSGISPSDIVKRKINAEGKVSTERDSPAHGDYPGATKTYLFPNQTLIADNSGTVYYTDTLKFYKAFWEKDLFDDLVFYQDYIIVQSNNSLHVFDRNFKEINQYTIENIDSALGKMIVFENKMYYFYYQDNSVQTKIFPMYVLTNKGIDPNGLQYRPDNIVMGVDGIIYILSKANNSIFRWSVESQKYLSTISLNISPDKISYSEQNNQIFVNYSDKVTKIDLSNSLIEQTYLTDIGSRIYGMEAVDNYLFVAKGHGGSWLDYMMYDPLGNLIEKDNNWGYPSTEFVWNQETRKLFYISGFSPSDLHYREVDDSGHFGSDVDSPYHSSRPFSGPIRISPDNMYVLLGTGRLFDTEKMNEIAYLSNDIVDATWTENNRLFTIMNEKDGFKLQEWIGSNFEERIMGNYYRENFLRLLSYENKLIIIKLIDNTPEFTTLNTDELDQLDSGLY